MLTTHELFRLSIVPFLPTLRKLVRKDLKSLSAQNHGKPLHILDVGGRNSPYTIGLPFQVTVLDLPRESDIQHQLHLGVSSDMLSELRKNRSNITQIVFQNMVHCTLPDAAFDGIICVEVLEHVREDAEFIKQIARVLKPGGWAYFTTPNGDYIRNDGPNRNPDHQRHYRREELAALLKTEFEVVNIKYGVKTGKYYVRGLRSFSIRKPFKTIEAMLCNLINRWESRNCSEQPRRTAHLLAIVKKSNSV
jgi:SAM-dependent methyltransferase